MKGMEKFEAAKKLARAIYGRELKKATPEEKATGLSPATATAAVAEKVGLPASRLIPVVAAIYYAENGKLAPISGTGAKLAKAIRSRRDAGGRMARWEVISASLVAGTNGRDAWPLSAVKALYEKGGGDLETSYTGRGTRVGAPATREDETAEVTA